MKQILFLLAWLVVPVLAFSQDNTQSTQGTKNTQTTQGTHHTQSKQSTHTNTSHSTHHKGNTSGGVSQDQHFVNEASKAGHMEVEMGEMGKKASQERVRNFAEMMVRDHTKANEELKDLLAKKNMKKPATPAATSMQEMHKKTGMDFDKAYMDQMVNDHKKAIALFEKESESGHDKELKDFAKNTLPTLRMHLDSAQAVRASLGNMSPQSHR